MNTFNFAIAAGDLWKGISPLTKTYESLVQRLMPPSGMASTIRGEAIRCVSHLYHDAYNNGGCNHGGYKWALSFLMEFIDLNSSRGDNAREAISELAGSVLEAEQDEDSHSGNYEDDDWEPWDALEDAGYLKNLEVVTAWVIWKAGQLDLAAVAAAEGGMRSEPDAIKLLRAIAYGAGTDGDTAKLALETPAERLDRIEKAAQAFFKQ